MSGLLSVIRIGLKHVAHLENPGEIEDETNAIMAEIRHAFSPAEVTEVSTFLSTLSQYDLERILLGDDTADVYARGGLDLHDDDGDEVFKKVGLIEDVLSLIYDAL